METRKFIKNAAILTMTALILRTIGMFFRIYLSNKIGAEGMGLYQLIFSIYILVATFATSGISTAVTRLIADELGCGTKRSVIRILRRSILLTTIIAIVSTVTVLLLSDVIAIYWIKDARATDALRILSLSLPFMGISSCLRGYFIACRRVMSPSNAQIFEQFIRIGVILVIINRFASQGVGAACTAVLIGDTIAEFASCLFLYVGFLRDKQKLGEKMCVRKNPPYKIVRKLLSIAIPITAGRYLTTLLRTIENLLVPGKLTQYTASNEVSLSLFGMLKGMALPILLFPSSFLTALSTLLIPELSSASSVGDKRSIASAVNRSVGITMSSSMIIAGLFLVLGERLGVAIYGSSEVGFMTKALAPLVPLMYLESVIDGMLKGLNQQVSSLAYNVADSIVRILLIFILVPKMGMIGFLLVMVVSNALTSLLCFNRLLKISEVKIKWLSWIIRPIGCTIASCIAVCAITSVLPSMGQWVTLIVCITLGCAIYFGLLALFGGVKMPKIYYDKYKRAKYKRG